MYTYTKELLGEQFERWYTQVSQVRGIYICIYVYMYMCVCVYILYIYIYIHIYIICILSILYYIQPAAPW